jgi:hypothetical protein
MYYKKTRKSKSRKLLIKPISPQVAAAISAALDYWQR